MVVLLAGFYHLLLFFVTSLTQDSDLPCEFPQGDQQSKVSIVGHYIHRCIFPNYEQSILTLIYDQEF